MNQITLENITKVYSIDNEEVSAVSNVSLKINKGEFVSIVGHSGSGKTTLLSIIGGITSPTSGRVLFDDMDIYSFDTDTISEFRCEKIGFIFQFSSLLPVLTVRENLLLPTIFKSKKHIKNPIETESRAVELLKIVGLGDKIDVNSARLSGGQQRRVAIARAFMNHPKFIIADEPTGDLDEDTEAEMMRFFMTMNEQKGITFIMVTHNTDIARQAGRQLRMSSGSIAEL